MGGWTEADGWMVGEVILPGWWNWSPESGFSLCGGYHIFESPVCRLDLDIKALYLGVRSLGEMYI